MNSKKYTLNKNDLKSIAIGLGVAAGGAALTYAASIVGNIDFGVYTPLAVALASVLINAGRKYLEGK